MSINPDDIPRPTPKTVGYMDQAAAEWRDGLLADGVDLTDPATVEIVKAVLADLIGLHQRHRPNATPTAPPALSSPGSASSAPHSAAPSSASKPSTRSAALTEREPPTSAVLDARPRNVKSTLDSDDART